jgi:hypothetical protein
MIQDLTEYTEFLLGNKLTPKQFYVLYALALDNRRAKKLPSAAQGNVLPMVNLWKFYQNIEQLTLEELKDLEERGYLVNRNDKGKTYADNIEVTPKFYKLVFPDQEAYDEFMDLYPGFAKKDGGGMFPLKVATEQETKEVYYRMIRTRADHSRMMRALRWAIKRGNVINVKVTNFLESRMWLDIEKLMETKDDEWAGVNI